MTELATTAFDRAALVLKREGKVALKDVAEVLVSDAPAPVPAQPKPPKVLELTEAQRYALDAIGSIFGTVQPDTVRALTDEENAALYGERHVIDSIIEPLTERREAIKDAVRNHMDIVAAGLGLVTDETPIDKDGHVVVAAKGAPERVAIPGTSQAWSREYRSPTVSLRGDRLLDMYEAGEIDRETYLSMTREVRVFDEDKAMAALSKNPGLLGVIAKLADKGQPSTALFVRKA